MRPLRAGSPPNVTTPSIRRTNSYDVRCHVKKAKHGYRIPVAEFTAVFDSYEEAHPFQIEYTILAGNVPNPSEGKLSIVIGKK